MTHATGGTSSTGVTSGPRVTPGRNRISSKAIRSIVVAVTARELGTSRSSVGVELSDNEGVLVVTARSPIGIPALQSAHGSPRVAAGQTLFDRVLSAQQRIRSRVLELTGASVGTVNIRITTAHIENEGRVS